VRSGGRSFHACENRHVVGPAKSFESVGQRGLQHLKFIVSGDCDTPTKSEKAKRASASEIHCFSMISCDNHIRGLEHFTLEIVACGGQNPPAPISLRGFAGKPA
jgi:hypothetical protein